ncbi:MAG: hypothetical protein J5492_05795 [Oxalobacter sp.]|nr:hypothetical protein [Oxalobacter sp.]
MEKRIAGLLLVLGCVSVAVPASAQEGEWLPVRHEGKTSYFIHTSDFKVSDDGMKNTTSHVWMRIEEGNDISVLRAYSDCKGETVLVEDKYTNGEQVKAPGRLTIEPGNLAEKINRAICTDMNFGD